MSMAERTQLDRTQMHPGAMVAPVPGSSVLDRVEREIYRVEAFIAGASLVVMLATIVFSVVARYFELPVPNVSELGIVAMAPLTFVGAALCTYARAHISVEIAQQLPSRLLRSIAHAGAMLSQLLFAGIFLYVAWEFFAYAYESNENLIDLGTPVAVPAGFMVAGSALMIVHALADLYRLVTGQPHPGLPNSGGVS